MSHEEPDLEVPPPMPLEPLAPAGTLAGRIDVRTVIAGILVAAIMGLSYPYMVLKLGFGPNVSVVAAFFGFLFLNTFDVAGLLVGRLRKRPFTRHYNRWQNNIAEAAGTSAAQTAFMCVLLGAFDLLRFNTHGQFSKELSWLDTFLWLTSACTLGVLLAVPLRRHFIVDEKLPFVDGLSTAETILVLDPPSDASAAVKKNALAAFRAVMLGVLLSGVLMVFRADAKLFKDIIPEGIPAPWVMGWTALAAMGVGLSYSFLSIGSGMLIGFRIDWSMLLGATLAWVVAPYLLTVTWRIPLHHEAHHLVYTTTPSRTEVLFWVMWPATGMLVAGGLTSLALRWRLLIDTFKSLRGAKISKGEMPLEVVIAGSAVAAVALCIVQYTRLGLPVWMTLAAILLSIPLMLVGLRVLGETSWGPISALSNMMQGIFAVVAPGNIVANMVASGTTGTVATSSESIMQDYKCGHMVGTKPRLLTIMQLLAVPIGAAAVATIYPVLVDTYGIVGDKAQLTSPISNKWAGFADILQNGVGTLPTSTLYALIAFSILGVVLTVLETNPKIRKFVPSPTGIGIGILVPFNVISTMMIGGIIALIWERMHKKSADVYMIPLASGLIAGEALIAVIVPLLLKLGIGAG